MCTQVRGAIVFMQILHKVAVARQARAFDLWAEWLPQYNKAEAVISLPSNLSAAATPSDLFKFQTEVKVSLG